MPTWPSIPRRPGFPAKGPDEWVIEADGVVFDGLRRRVQVDGYLVRLPGREAAVLSVLMARPGQVVNWSALLSAVWSDTSGAHHSAVDRLL
jgi:DNA-binding response OmpR family regulator